MAGVGEKTASNNHRSGDFDYPGWISELGVVIAAAAVPIFGVVQRKKRMHRQRRPLSSTATMTMMMEKPLQVTRKKNRKDGIRVQYTTEKRH